MDLYLVRHAIAEPRDRDRWPDDSARPLSSEGAELFRVAARGLRRMGTEVDVVLASSYVRSWQTAELLAGEAEWPAPEELAALEPSGTSLACVDALRARSESAVALVGHQPNLSLLGSYLLAGDEHALQLEFKKGGVSCLRFPRDPLPGSAVLRWSVSPKILRQLGR